MDLKINSRLAIPFVLLCLSFTIHLCQGADTITGKESLSGNESLSGDGFLISSGENFKLGFFKPGNSSYYYIGIWYNKVSEQTVVWVANRGNPVSSNTTELKFLNGNLVLVNDSNIPAWSTNLTTPGSSSLRATLEDDGNLVLRNGSNSSLWESFDHPTHTWLPGGRLGRNNLDNTSQKLTSWKNADDPAPGLFYLELQPSSEYFIWWNGSYSYWTSGTWDDKGKLFRLVPEMNLNYIYNFTYVDGVNESYFTYTVYNSSILSRFIMDLSGQVKQLTWLESTKNWNLFWSQPRQQCEVHNFCGPFGLCTESTDNFCSCLYGFQPESQSDWDLKDYSGGCKRNTTLQCASNSTSVKKDGFLPLESTGQPSDAVTALVEGAGNCELYCLNNCSCNAYSYDDDQCSIWIGDLFNVQANTGNGTVSLRLAASDIPKSSSNKTAIIAGSVGGAVALLVIILLGIWIWRSRGTGKSKTVEGSLVAFVYRDLQAATKNFSEKLGGGGFGSVFKGSLPDLSFIAVKKLENIGQGEKQFRTEVSTIGTIQHVNLVRLRGFCSEGNKKLLVYDFMPNGSLDFHLFNKKDSNVLDWKTRYQIALGIARGLTYLHEKCRDCIIHCDIKPENILLDAEFCPKVADFGLAKLVGREFSRVLTTMRGTRGYLAPEWISGVAITAKADVYSYGMMLFEIVSGRRNSEQSEDGTIKFFPTWAASKTVGGGDLLDLLDPGLERDADIEELTKICRVACWCIQDDENNRPSMSQVVQILEGILDVNLPPQPRSLQVFVDNQENIVFFTESSSSGSSQPKSATSTASQNSQTKSNTSNASSQSQQGNTTSN